MTKISGVWKTWRNSFFFFLGIPSISGLLSDLSFAAVSNSCCSHYLVQALPTRFLFGMAFVSFLWPDSYFCVSIISCIRCITYDPRQAIISRVSSFSCFWSKIGESISLFSSNLLEKISSICVAEKWNRVGHHPDVASATVKVRLTPFSVFVGDSEDLVVESLRVGRLVRRVRVICWNRHNVKSLC